LSREYLDLKWEEGGGWEELNNEEFDNIHALIIVIK
jgi:hypothetical protein